jgi:hypothetical protein
MGNLSRLSPDKQRLLACAWCRRAWHLLRDARSRHAVEVAERFADGMATPEELVRSFEAAVEAVRDMERRAAGAAAHAAAGAAAFAAGTRTDWWMSLEVSRALAAARAGEGEVEEPRERDAHQYLLEDVESPAGVTLDRAWLVWNRGAILKLAQAVYDDRDMPSGNLDAARLAVLADMVEEAGCSDPQLLGHLRRPGPHVRGCWAVDALLL